MRASDWEITENQQRIVFILFNNAFRFWRSSAASWALVVSVLNNGYLGVFIAVSMVGDVAVTFLSADYFIHTFFGNIANIQPVLG